MTKTKFLILFFSLFLIGQTIIYIQKHSTTTNYNYENYIINNDTYKIDELSKIFDIVSSDNHTTILYSVYDQETKTFQAYCSSVNCPFNEVDYYSTKNDKHATKIIPIMTKKKTNIYSFTTLTEFDISSLSLTFVGSNSDISKTLNELKKYGITYSKNQAIEGNSNLVYDLLIIFFTVITLIFMIIESFISRKYIIERLNGYYLKESFTITASKTIKMSIIPIVLNLLIIDFQLNNNVLFTNLFPKVLYMYLIYIFALLFFQFIICVYYRRKINTITYFNPIQTVALISLLILTLAGSSTFAYMTIDSLVYNIEKISKLPPSKFNNYFTYGVTMPGVYSFDIANNVVDPRNVEFYMRTEDDYHGIVSSFDIDTNYGVVNYNYLDAVNINLDLNKSYVNILVNDNSLDNMTYPDFVKIVKCSDQTFPYIAWDTGLVEYYDGPVVVINHNLVSKIDTIGDYLVPMHLQNNNYFVTGNISELNAIIKDIQFEDYMIGLYTVPSIANHFTNLEFERLIKNGSCLLFITFLELILISIYLKTTFEITKKQMAIKYFNGQSLLQLLLHSRRVILLSICLPILVDPSAYTVIYCLLLVIAVTLLIKQEYTKLTKHKHKYIRE